MISYTSDISKIESKNLEGFFVGWPNPPNKETFYKLLHSSYKFITAMEDSKVIGFITSISDGVLSAYIPLLEVLPDYQSRGIGAELVVRMKKDLEHLYMVDLLCDNDLIPFYEKLGMTKSSGALLRNYDRQDGSLS